ncbi:MAG: response regulator [candidate division Zixibacteria bacterium]|nr:response regulator [candidate division Zixibacteria bacterium]
MKNKAKILLVDDEERMCESLKTLLEIEGYSVNIYTDSKIAADSLKNNNYDLVITDIKMPGLDGLELLNLARASDPHLEVILMTGYASLQSAKDAVDQGAFSYLTKPLEFEELKMSTIRSLEKRQIALEKESLLKELKETNAVLEKKLAEIDALYSAGTILATTIDLTEALSQILSLAIDVIGAKIGSVMILNPDEKELYIGAACGLSKEILEKTRLKLGSSISGYVAETGKPLIVENIEEDHRFSRINRQHYESKSLISVPLKYKGNVLGVINLNNKMTGTAFNKEDLKVLSTFAAQAAIAIDRANIFADKGEKINELTVLFEIARNISIIDNPDQVGEIIFNELRKLIHIEAIIWYSYEERKKGFRLEFLHGSENCPKEMFPPSELKMNKEVIGLESDVDINHINDELMKWFADNWPGIEFAIEIIPVQVHKSTNSLMVILANNEFDASGKNLAAVVASQAASVYERQKAILSGMKMVTMGRMISEICHDLKKPLTNLKGSVQIYRDKIKGKEAANFFASSEKEMNRLHDLVMEMVNFANPNKYNTTREDLKTIVEKASNLLERDFEKKKINLTIDQDEDVPQILVNSREIFEAVLNIMLNSTESMEENGSLKVKIGIQQSDEPFVRIAISDDGSGIPQDKITRIFDRYYTTKEAGTGLGLAIVERVIEAHNGRLDVESEVGKGTTFNIDLPVNTHG